MTVIVSDFDGTITKEDSLYNFFDIYADKSWLDIEELWKQGKISSKECLIKEFELVKDLSEELIDKYVKNIEIDENFAEFYDLCKRKNIDFIVVSDGVDYFINKILNKYNIKKIKTISNHGEFINNKFVLTFPNGYEKCNNDAGTCKCKIVKDLIKKDDEIYYIGDGTSDFCVSKNAGCLFKNLFAKSKLIQFAEENNINYQPITSFKDISKLIRLN